MNRTMRRNFNQMVASLAKERDADLIERYEKGERLEFIESLFGISKTRIYQILDKYRIPRRLHNKDKESKGDLTE